MRVYSRRFLVSVSGWLLCSLAFTQLALAASGCLTPGNELAKAINLAKQPSCHEEAGISANLCLAHCTADAQTFQQGDLTPPALGPVRGDYLVVPIDSRPITVVVPLRVAVHATDPPIPIRFCCFLN